MPRSLISEELQQSTLRTARRWVDTEYYNQVERSAESQWRSLILPFLGEVQPNFDKVLELAVGHGRMTQILLEVSNAVIGVDVLKENIDFCKARFKANPKLKLVQNNGTDLRDVADSSITFGFCFDSMVHFDSDVVRNYLREFYRIMAPQALAFFHHSNLTRNPGGDFQTSAHARNFMSVEQFAHYAAKEGLAVVRSKKIDWGKGEKHIKALDGLALLQKRD